MGRLDGKVALVTGAGSGIGRSVALLFSGEGARVAVLDWASDLGKETVAMIEEDGREAIFVEADVSKAADVQRAVQEVVHECGTIDILINNAGLNRPMAPAAEFPEEDWDVIVDVNLKGVFLCSKYVIPVMLAGGSGAIVNVASIVGLVATAGQGAYGAAKAGIIHLTKSVALDYAAQHIRVNCICPGPIDTPMTASALTGPIISYIPQRRVGQPKEVAQAALFLASDEALYITGANLVVDGGWSVRAAHPQGRDAKS